MLSDPELYKKGEKTKSISLEYKEIQIQIDHAYTNWSALIHQLEQIEKNA